MAKHTPRNPSNAPSPGRKSLPGILGGAVLVLLLAAVLLPQLSGRFPKLEIAGHRITREEYLQAMYQARNDILSDHAAAGISLKDWNEDTSLGSPRELLTLRTLEILTEYYAICDLAVERGYLADASYEAMLRDMQDINRQRQEALESGAVVTGIPQFTAGDYMTYRASNLRILFTNDENNPEIQVTPEEIHQRYDADKENLYALPDTMELSFLRINTAPEETDALAGELEALRQLALEKGSLAQALAEMPRLKAYYEEISVDRGSYSIYYRSHGDILSYAQTLQAGDISEVFRQDGQLCLVQCHRRTQGTYASLEDVQSVVVQSIREDRYEALIAARMDASQVDADLPALIRFTADHLN